MNQIETLRTIGADRIFTDEDTVVTLRVQTINQLFEAEYDSPGTMDEPTK